MGFFSIFKKSNDYNEKVVIGFMSFMVMVIAIIVDLVTGYMGKALDGMRVKFHNGVTEMIPRHLEEYDAEGKQKRKIVASRKQYPLKLAWAFSIHKSRHDY